jgi:nucleotide-binding universal stress UspA family protein
VEEILTEAREGDYDMLVVGAGQFKRTDFDEVLALIEFSNF